MIRKIGIFAIAVACIFISCPDSTDNGKQSNGENNGENTGVTNNPPATVNFFNESSFKIDIYKNLNPDYFDPTTLVCSVNPGSTQKVTTLYASADQKIGDTFYPRYKVLLADSFETGTTDIRVDAQRDMSNISFVVESGKTYTKTVPQPSKGQLKFINGYIAVQNMGASQVQILKADDMLYKLDDNGAYLNPGQNKGYYQIPVSVYSETVTMNQLKAYSGTYTDFPAFDMERGKLYSFTVNGGTVTGPVITNLDPMR